MLGLPFLEKQPLNLPEKADQLLVPVVSAAVLDGGQKALAISHCDSGADLDITRGLEIWVFVQWIKDLSITNSDQKEEAPPRFEIVPGMGVGKFEGTGEICISKFAHDLLKSNLNALVPVNTGLRLEIVFPRGRQLALRTSNAAFGVVDGLALIGTQAEAYESASPNQLQITIQQLRNKVQNIQKDFPFRIM